MPVYAGMINSVYKTSWFIFYRKDVKYLLRMVQENINSSMRTSLFSITFLFFINYFTDIDKITVMT